MHPAILLPHVKSRAMIIFIKGTRSYAIFLAVDCWCAGLIGMRFGDKYSISAQCYRSPCRLCKWVGSVLNLIQPDHFKIAAELEDLQQ